MIVVQIPKSIVVMCATVPQGIQCDYEEPVRSPWEEGRVTWNEFTPREGMCIGKSLSSSSVQQALTPLFRYP